MPCCADVVHVCREGTQGTGTCLALAAMWGQQQATGGQHQCRQAGASCRAGQHTLERMVQVRQGWGGGHGAKAACGALGAGTGTGGQEVLWDLQQLRSAATEACNQSCEAAWG